jgi:hypothetical protein
MTHPDLQAITGWCTTGSWDSNPDLQAIMAQCSTIILPAAGTQPHTSRLSQPNVLPLYYRELRLKI